MPVYVWEVRSLPDLSRPIFRDLGDTNDKRQSKVIQETKNFLDAFHRIASEGDSMKWSVSLRFLYKEGQIQIFLIIKVPENSGDSTSNPKSIEALFPGNQSVFPFGFLNPQNQSDVLKISDATNVVDWARHCLGLRKKQSTIVSNYAAVPERKTSNYDSTLYPKEFWVPAEPVLGKINDQDNLFQAMAALKENTMVEVTLIPTTLGRDEQELFVNAAAHYKLFLSDKVYDNQIYWIKDPNAEKVYARLQKIIDINARVSSRFIYAIRFFSQSSANRLATTFQSNSTSNPDNLEIFDLDTSVANHVKAISIEVDTNLKPADSYHSSMTAEELAGIFAFPLPLRSPFHGFDVYDRNFRLPKPLDGAEKIKLGVSEGGRPIQLSIGDIRRHMLIVGTSGSGKTTTMFHILSELKKKSIPWMVLEPAKTEYRAIRSIDHDLLVFTLGDELVAPFRFNPLDVPVGSTVEKHISRLNNCFQAAFNLFDPLPMLLDESIRQTYRKAGWSAYSIGGDKHLPPRPMLADLYREAEKVVKEAGYTGETQNNIKGALLNRIKSLLRGSVGRMLNVKQGLYLDELLTKNVVLEMDSLNGDEKALLMMFIFTQVYQLAKKRGSNSPLSHVLVIEEAHNLIGTAGHNSENRANTRAHAIELFTNMLAEMRSLGQGIIVLDQLPSSLAPQAIKNTNIKLVHQLVSGDDREVIGLTMGFDRDDVKFHSATSSFRPGEGFFFGPELPEGVRIRLEPNEAVKALKEEPPPTDSELRLGKGTGQVGMLQQYIQVQSSTYMPFDLCKEICLTHCNPQIREFSENSIDNFLLSRLKKPDSDATSNPKALLEKARNHLTIEHILGSDNAFFDYKGTIESRKKAGCLVAHVLDSIPKLDTGESKQIVRDRIIKRIHVIPTEQEES